MLETLPGPPFIYRIVPHALGLYRSIWRLSLRRHGRNNGEEASAKGWAKIVGSSNQGRRDSKRVPNVAKGWPSNKGRGNCFPSTFAKFVVTIFM